MRNELYEPDLYFNSEFIPVYAVDEVIEPEIKTGLTLEQRKIKWSQDRWLDEPSVKQDDWLFTPLPSEQQQSQETLPGNEYLDATF